jgi:hypothetical protein
MKKPKTLEEANDMLAEIRQGFAALYADAESDDDDCFWCCGGGDERVAELSDRERMVLAMYPDAKATDLG